MREAILIVFCLFIASFWEILISPVIAIYGIEPNIGVMLVAFFALYRTGFAYAFFAFLWGLIIDSVSPGNMGWNSLILILIGSAISFIRNHFNWQGVSTQVAVVFLSVLVHTSVNYIIQNIDSLGNFFYFIVRFAVASALYSGIIWLLIQYLPVFRYRTRGI
ncbi:MAG: rod shape-determining protein MreD [candidate division Zixibacteria bacterium]|nr:rod shape-determining protein MreD [candidate division Zixibacteria bacterium]